MDRDDPSKNVAKLKGVAVYAAASTGAVGAVVNLAADFPTPVGGQVVEGITLDCTQHFVDARKPQACQSLSSSDRKAPTPGDYSTRRCASRGTR